MAKLAKSMIGTLWRDVGLGSFGELKHVYADGRMCIEFADGGTYNYYAEELNAIHCDCGINATRSEVISTMPGSLDTKFVRVYFCDRCYGEFHQYDEDVLDSVSDDSDNHAYPSGRRDPTPLDDRVDTDVMGDPAPDAVPAETAYANDTLEQVDAELRMVGIEPFHWQQLKAELARRQAEVINLNQTLDLYREAVRQIDMRMRFVRDPLKRWEPEVEMIDFGTWLCNTKRDYQFTQDLKRLIDKINLAKGLNALDSNTEARPAP